MGHILRLFLRVGLVFSATTQEPLRPDLLEFKYLNLCQIKYEVIRFLAKGSYGRVYEARERHAPHKKVAIKQLMIPPRDLPDFARGREVDMMNFIKAVQSQSQPENTKNIIEVRCVEHEMELIVTELCENGDLFSFLLKKRRLSKADFRLYLPQLVNVMQFLEHHRIIHHDIRPTNFCLTAKDEQLKLIDFGMAERADSSKEVDLSVIRYMAPEMNFQHLKRKPRHRHYFTQVDPELRKKLRTEYPVITDAEGRQFYGHTNAVDIYALGATLHDMFVGLGDTDARNKNFGCPKRRTIGVVVSTHMKELIQGCVADTHRMTHMMVYQKIDTIVKQLEEDSDDKVQINNHMVEKLRYVAQSAGEKAVSLLFSCQKGGMRGALLDE